MNVVRVAWLVLFAACARPAPPATSATAASPSLVGAWALDRCDDIHPDGSRTQPFGASPRGVLIFGDDGRYALQLYHHERPGFASGSKRTGTPAEYQAAALTMSAHVGRYALDAAAGTVAFRIEHASFPNWAGTEQVRAFTLRGDELTYRVPPTVEGIVGEVTWRRRR
jgi:hypothetical protein